MVSTPDDVKYTIWKDNDPTDNVAPNTFPNVIYQTMNNDTASVIIKENLGSFDVEKMINLSRAVADDDSNLMDVVYDATTLELWVAYANGADNASNQSYVHISMKEFMEKAGIEL